MHDSPVSGRRWIFVTGNTCCFHHQHQLAVPYSGMRSQRLSDLLPNCTSLPMTEDSEAKNSPM
ncbi:hypothetical protein T4B_12079 [Trichinella pseudospiralis]|uniref:Uncharacterized protein n=1 Tax=Trichinella pseudospiralis TaxID=6337 RepID=A0A0V1H3F7_TRIPS|nr:hypothetical protein T4B_12079 [Trichinella pseudospiralis]